MCIIVYDHETGRTLETIADLKNAWGVEIEGNDDDCLCGHVCDAATRAGLQGSTDEANMRYELSDDGDRMGIFYADIENKFCVR